MSERPQLILLAGGKSKRFWPLGDKLGLKFFNRSFLEHQLQVIKRAGFIDPVVVISAELNGLLADQKVAYVIQKGDGQAAAILSAASHIQNRPVLIVNADDVIEAELLKQMLPFFGDKVNRISGLKVKSYQPLGYLVLDGTKIARIHEKPGEGNEPSSYVKMVCDYIYDGSLLLQNIKKCRPQNPDHHYEEALTQMMQSGVRFEMVEYRGTFIPLKFPWQTLDVMHYFLSQIKKSALHQSVKIDKSAKIDGPVIIGKNVRVMENAKISGPAYIGAGTIVGNQTLIRQSMIGENCVIGFTTEITRSFIGTDSWFHDNFIGDSVTANHCAFGSGAVLANLRFDENLIKSRVKGVYTNTGKQKLGGLIGEGARIGVGTLIMPGIKVGKNSLVGPGVVLNEDLMDNHKCLVKQQFEITDNRVSNIHDRQKFRKQIDKK